ncbi:Uncharacterised protein [Yersinia enterocolitica]|nr:Uncharacterised protein [Yersinia enterocolitica]
MKTLFYLIMFIVVISVLCTVFGRRTPLQWIIQKRREKKQKKYSQRY